MSGVSPTQRLTPDVRAAETQQTSPLLKLSPALQNHILSFVGVKEAAAFERTCKANAAADREVVWKRLFQRYCPHLQDAAQASYKRRFYEATSREVFVVGRDIYNHVFDPNTNDFKALGALSIPYCKYVTTMEGLNRKITETLAGLRLISPKDGIDLYSMNCYIYNSSSRYYREKKILKQNALVSDIISDMVTFFSQNWLTVEAVTCKPDHKYYNHAKIRLSWEPKVSWEPIVGTIKALKDFPATPSQESKALPQPASAESKETPVLDGPKEKNGPENSLESDPQESQMASITSLPNSKTGCRVPMPNHNEAATTLPLRQKSKAFLRQNGTSANNFSKGKETSLTLRNTFSKGEKSKDVRKDPISEKEPISKDGLSKPVKRTSFSLFIEKISRFYKSICAWFAKAISSCIFYKKGKD